MAPSIGQPVTRVDGRLKVTGRARYTTEHPVPNVAHAVLVTSAIARGRIASIDAGGATRLPGVLAVMTHENAPKLRSRPPSSEAARSSNRVVQLLQDDGVRYAGQPIGVVVAETLETAREAASLVAVRYVAEPPDVRLEARLAYAHTPKQAARPDQPPDSSRGDVGLGLSEAGARIAAVYTTPFETHVPMEPHATMAVWDGPAKLTLYDATQGIFGVRRRVAELLGLEPENVHVISPFLGGGFGSKGPTWSHVALAAMAARQVNRPVKLALSRPQTFGPVGWRSRTRQKLTVGVKRDGALTALRHDTVGQTSTFDEFMEPASVPTRMAYACPNTVTSHRLVRSDIGTPVYTRAPGWAPGTYALECAMDEMAYAIEMDPIQFRLTNHADDDPETRRPWSSKSLRECYRVGAERFGWSRRPFAPGTLRDGPARIGWGMATAVYPAHRNPASAVARLRPDGTVLVESGTQDIGTGTYTVMTQIAADALGLPVDRVSFRLGDTDYPEAPLSAGSQTAASTGSAVHLAAKALRDTIVTRAVADVGSPLSGARVDDVVIEDGRVLVRGEPSRGETLAELARRHAGRDIEARVDATPGDEHDRYSMYAFGAQFAEVRVDADLGMVRVSRMVGVFGAGRILNAHTARNQLAGGMVWGIGMALHEATMLDERLGRIVNANLAEYHIPVQTDVPAIDVTWIDEVDEHVNPIGVKGIGEVGITGAAAAVANAVFHATGKRVRDLPITLDKLF
jgi:xanthine dehydrogenase YagR molybdenum-binding subunit